MASPPLSFASIDFDRTPFLVCWEVTQACPLACIHCRAEANEHRDPHELTLAEGRELLAQMQAMGTPVCVLTGGDPLKRPDLADLVRYGHDLGIRMATIPAACQDLSRDKLVALKGAGLAQVALSLDGSTAAHHDDFRKVPGTFDWTMRAVEWAHELDLPLQINTTFAQYNYADVDHLIRLVQTLGIVFWEVFSLVPVGRGTLMTPLSAQQHEDLFATLYDLSKQVSFIIKMTEAPHYRRYVLQQRARQDPGGSINSSSRSAIPAQLSREMSARDSFGSAAKGINDGKGFCFVSHVGDVYPSGFFPRPVGNVRQSALASLYRGSELFRALRDPRRLKGRCGACEYADVCGGSRARAYTMTGDYLAEDPACLYQPPGWQPPG